MPLYEFLKLAIENLEASKNKSCSTEQSSRMENNLDEVVREDSPTHQSLSPITPNVLDASLGTSTIEYLNGFDSIFNEISPVAELDGLPDYLSDRLPEVSSVKTKGGSCDQAVGNLDKNFSFENFTLSSWPPQRGQTSDTSQLSGISSIVSNNTSDRHDGLFEDLTQGKDVGSPKFLSFSSFLRPAAAVKANLTVSGGVSYSVSSGFVEENGSACRCSNPVKSTPIQPLNSIQIDMALHVSSAQTAVDSGQVSVKKRKESFLDRGKDNFCEETVGSGNSGNRVSNAEPRNSRRKFCDVESEYHSDDIQNESTGVKTPTPARQGTGSKKSRTSEVHNLSERRRRDRINEKMRALQELIPNCNKADKASMLDEAIQYLKYLQHQVQVMPMRGGYSVPQMMYSPGHQHMFHAPLHHCSHMGMSMSYGSMNSGSPQFPVLQENLQGSCVLNLLRPGCPSTATAPRPPLVP